MRRLSVLLALVGAFLFRPAVAAPPHPFAQDPIGTISDVTDDWMHYQPRDVFCIQTRTGSIPGDDERLYSGSDPDCAASGWLPSDTALTKISLEGINRTAPDLCPGCRRLFIDFSAIPAVNAPPYYYAHGHAYYRLMSNNFGYTVDPYSHSPNTKNFTNDKLVVPEGSTQYPIVYGFDLHAMAYVTDTVSFWHETDQGPWYAGPWYVNTAGDRINGIYLDVDVAGAGAVGYGLDEIGYQSGFNDGEPTCIDNNNASRRDGDYYYGGCVNHFGGSSSGIDPWQ
ncbi:MAG: hypothetical protein ABR548_06065 [Actinomycetota bacterium]|nr:hypothetical protein [Actinomycetota bacterium]